MNEDEAVDKIKNLMSSIDTVTRYSNAGSKFPLVFLLFLLGVVGTNLITIILDIYDYQIVSAPMSSVNVLNGTMIIEVGFFWLPLWAVLIFLAYRILHKPLVTDKPRDWEKDLDEGIIGVMKIIEKHDWESTLADLKKARRSFIVISGLQFFVSWLLVLFFVALGAGLIDSILKSYINDYIILGISLVIVLVLGDRSIQKSYRELWYVDDLITELRWFYLEFERSGI